MRTSLAAIVLCLVTGAANANFVSISFDEFGPGTYITNQYDSRGVTFSLDGSGAPVGPREYEHVIPANAFGTSGGTIVPGDSTSDSQQHDMRLSFSQRVNYFSIFALDAEEGFDISAYLDGALVATATKSSLGNLGPASIYFLNGPVIFSEIDLRASQFQFDTVVIDLTNNLGSSSGGPEVWDNISFNRVPEPSVMVLFVSSLLLLFGFRGRMPKHSS